MLAGVQQSLADECCPLPSDAAGRRWRRTIWRLHVLQLADRLHLVSSLFDRLRRRIDPIAKAFARSLHYDLGGRAVAMTDCWANVMPAGVVHSMHLHPTSFISGTYYAAVPRGAGALKFEDPRLSRHMAAPPRRADAPERFRSFVGVPAKAGDLVLFESWLPHEVPPARFTGERSPISFTGA